MPEPQRITALAEALADGDSLDWDSAERDALEDGERQTISQLRAIAAVERLFGTLSGSPADRRHRTLLPRDSAWGSLRILEHVGHGRFGDVYRAWDPALDREVALKILYHVDGEEAVETHTVKEGRMMARVRHPNVVTIHGAQRIGGVTGLWMEFIKGRTLAAELAERGPFPADELVCVGIELCHALAAVHGAGLVHRDVKAQNALRDDQGRIMLGDFGTGRELADLEATAGTLAGTPAYVAPELFAGQRATTQSDLYSLGTLLFHLATGSYPVPGRTLRDLRDAHAKRTRTALRPLRPDLSSRMAHIIETALQPDPACRFKSAESMARAFEESTGSMLWRRSAMAGIAVALAAAVLIAAWSRISDRSTVSDANGGALAAEVLPDGVIRTSVFAPPGARFFFQGPSGLSLSPDGKYLAFTALMDDDRLALWVQPLGGGPPRQLPGTEGAFGPFWSPDSEWLAFFASGSLQKVHIHKGKPVTICALSPALPGDERVREGTWGKDDVILFNRDPDGVIYQGHASDGSCEPVTTRQAEEHGHRWPVFLPDGRRFLYHARNANRKLHGVYAASLDSAEISFVVQTPQGALYAPSGDLVFVRENKLVIAPFDVSAARLTGAATTIADTLASDNGFRLFHASTSQFSISNTGVLAYVEAVAPMRHFKWFDRAGKTLGELPVQNVRGFPAVSHDGRRVAIEVDEPQSDNTDVWVYDNDQRVARRITRHPARDYNPHWSPDDQSIAFVSDRRGTAGDIYRISTTGSDEQFVFGSERTDDVTSWNGDGRYLVFNRGGATATINQLWLYSLADRAPLPLFTPPFHVFAARMSPDGRWVAHSARQADGNEIWIRGVPPVTGEWRVGKGNIPTWRSDGKEVYYLSPVSAEHPAPKGSTIHTWMMAVPFISGSQPRLGTPEVLFGLERYTGNLYDAAPDGQRFLINAAKNMEALNNTAITIVQNWPRLVQSRKAVAAR